MKRKLTKDFHFSTYGGPDCYKAGTVLTGKKHPHGLLMENFICYGINELVHEEYFEPAKEPQNPHQLTMQIEIER